MARRRRSGLRDARIRTKLALIMVIPVCAVVSLAALRLVDSGRQAVSAQTVRSLSTLSSTIFEITDDLQHEQILGAALLATDDGGAGTSADSRQASYSKAAESTDEAVSAFARQRKDLTGLPASVADSLAQISYQLDTLSGLRKEVSAGPGPLVLSVSESVLRYSVIIDALVAYHDQVAQQATDDRLADQIRAVAAFDQAKAATAREQAIGYAMLSSGRVDAQQYNVFVATLTSQQEALTNFYLAADTGQRVLVDQTITGEAVQLADHVADQIARSVNQPTPRIAATDAAQVLGSVVDLMRWVEQRLDTGAVATAAALEQAVVERVLIESALVILALLLAVTLTLAVARSMVRALSTLRAGALSVAHRDLPEAVARLRDVDELGGISPDEVARQVTDPLRMDSEDEIGQVAHAFNTVHREAVRIAAEQAALRGSVSAMFLNLARRSQNLVDRMIGELDSIERTEEDPQRLARLFQLDHLATRMRRNDENLLVLAGADSSSPRRDDAQLADVVRAAQSEVEHYDRIEFGVVDLDVLIAARAVNDVVRLLAELYDNATRFSPPKAAVLCDARRIGDYVLIHVEDRGLGMPPEQLGELNELLVSPPMVGVSAFRMMGLAVVARLAARYGVRVQLRPNSDRGIVAEISLPASILILPRIAGREPARHRELVQAISGRPAPSPLAALTSGPEPRGNGQGNAFAPQSRPATPAAVPAVPAVSVPLEVRLPPNPVAVGGYDSPAVAAGTPSGPRGDETAEMPIFRAIEQIWFRGQPDGDGGSAGPAAPMTAALGWETRANPVAPAGSPTATGRATPPPPPVPPVTPPAGHESSEMWRTAADDGWRAAAAAAAPQPASNTRSGLPKRVPSAQLVPGGIDARQRPATSRRSPDEVRGLLSTYHRGVQRGRATTHNPFDPGTPANEETHR